MIRHEVQRIRNHSDCYSDVELCSGQTALRHSTAHGAPYRISSAQQKLSSTSTSGRSRSMSCREPRPSAQRSRSGILTHALTLRAWIAIPARTQGDPDMVAPDDASPSCVGGAITNRDCLEVGLGSRPYAVRAPSQRREPSQFGLLALRPSPPFRAKWAEVLPPHDRPRHQKPGCSLETQHALRLYFATAEHFSDF